MRKANYKLVYYILVITEFNFLVFSKKFKTIMVLDLNKLL